MRRGQGRGERAKGSSHCRNEGEGGRGAAVQTELCGGVGRERGE